MLASTFHTLLLQYHSPVAFPFILFPEGITTPDTLRNFSSFSSSFCLLNSNTSWCLIKRPFNRSFSVPHPSKSDRKIWLGSLHSCDLQSAIFIGENPLKFFKLPIKHWLSFSSEIKTICFLCEHDKIICKFLSFSKSHGLM